MTDPQTALEAGSRLGPYKILEAIGAGGMGEVYRALDTRLDRVVAIKLLNRYWAEDSGMRQRFEREAQIIASLNHPNICVLHDVGKQNDTDFLVMEYLEGETLAARLARKPLELDEALRMAIAIADALDKAHRRGVVHRDLKPSNIILTPSGLKLLDFGLAKRRADLSSSDSGRPSGKGDSPAPAPSPSQAQTRSTLTSPGTMLGTLQYMAPEQLEGLEADARTDIFAFGAVLHEMITGKRAFEGKSRILLISAIATAEPQPLSKVQANAPPALDHLVKTCLAKSPQDRWQTMRDLLAELEWIVEAGAETGKGMALAPTAGQRKRTMISWILLAAASILVAVAAVSAAIYFGGTKEPGELRFQFPFSATAGPDNTYGTSGIATRTMAGANFALSPDGRSLAFISRTGANEPWSLFVRPIGSVAPQKLAGAEDAAEHTVQPFWSADSRFIAFVTGGKLKKIEASGGPAQEICSIAGFAGGTWNQEGIILFGSGAGLFRVSAEGGKPESVTSLERGESGHYWPHFLPDGQHYLYTVWHSEAAKRAILAGMLGSKEKTRVAAGESNTAYSEPGFLVFRRENAVYAQPFNRKKLALSGEPVRIADEISFSSANGWSDFAASPNGVLVYFQSTGLLGGGDAWALADWQLAWVDRMGRVLETPGPPGMYWGMDASPNGKRIAVHRHDANGGDIIVIEPRGSTTRLTFDASRHSSSPVWSPNGEHIAYCALQKGKWGLYQTLSSGSGSEELLYESDLPKAPMSWSPDGKRIVFWIEDPKNGGDIWVLTLEDKKAAPLIASAFNETHAQVSADGKWIAYTSNSTGRNEIYVQPFPSGAGRYQISYHGGDWPRWRRDGKEIFYHMIASTPDTPAINSAFRGGSLMSTTVNSSGAVFEPGSPKDIVRTGAMNWPHSGGPYQTYDVSADGQMILTFQLGNLASLLPLLAGTSAIDPPYSMTVAMNWPSSLKGNR
jgi:Tol biopolymer transport system component